MITRKVLLLCVHNGARSQMAEAIANKLGLALFFDAESAGWEQVTLHPPVAQTMSAAGIDISGNPNVGWF